MRTVEDATPVAHLLLFAQFEIGEERKTQVVSALGNMCLENFSASRNRAIS